MFWKNYSQEAEMRMRRRRNSFRGKFLGWAVIIGLVYVFLIILQMIVTWGQATPLRREFLVGGEIAECTRISWDEGLDCNGYYDNILEQRTELFHRNGCVLVGAWWLYGGRPEPLTVWVSGPICYKPFPFGSVF